MTNSVDPDEMPHSAASHQVYTVCPGLSDRIHTVKYKHIVSHAQTVSRKVRFMNKSSMITNGLSTKMAGLIIDYLFSPD